MLLCGTGVGAFAFPVTCWAWVPAKEGTVRADSLYVVRNPSQSLFFPPIVSLSLYQPCEIGGAGIIDSAAGEKTERLGQGPRTPGVTELLLNPV